MSIHEVSVQEMENSMAVISACYSLTDQYRLILVELGKEYGLSENEMLVLIHLGLNPDVHTQKKLQSTQLNLSVSSVCRMVDHLRKKNYVSTELDENDRRSWIIHVEESGMRLTEEFQFRLHRRMEQIFSSVAPFDFSQFVNIMTKAGVAARTNEVTVLGTAS